MELRNGKTTTSEERPDDDIIVMLSKLLGKHLELVYRRSRYKYSDSEYMTIVTNFIMSYGKVTGIDMRAISNIK